MNHNLIIKNGNVGVEFRDPKDGALWECVPVNMIRDGYRLVGTVDRPDGTIDDLGQNAEGQFRIFRRSTDPWAFYSHERGRVLSDQDLQGFGLSRRDSYEPTEPEAVQAEGEYSSLHRSNLILPQGV